MIRFHHRLGRTRFAAGLFALLIAALTGNARADVKLTEIFGDHMVLQQGAKLPVWGTADPGEKVTVTFGTASASAETAADGRWRVDLPPVPQDTKPGTMTVAGKNKLTFQDVLVGDVWFASGQSNMDFGIGNDGRAAETIAKANEPQIRLFMVPRQLSLEPMSTFSAVVPGHLEGRWQVCSPAILSGTWGWNGFSALAYYFGREIHHHLNRPIGMIQSAWGGTQVAGWTSISGLEKNPVMTHYVADHQKRADNFAQATKDYPKLRAAGTAAFNQWNEQYGIPFQKELAQWNLDLPKAVAAGKAVPPKPRFTGPPKPPGVSPPDGWIFGGGNLFNGMVNPVIPYAIKGVIWLQGENDRGNAFEYFTSFPGLIADWREKWKEGDFPFLFVQLSNGNPPQDKRPIEDYTATLREAQAKTLSVPNTGMAVAIDIGSALDIHYKDKFDAGLRLALVARRVAYGETVVAYGPMYDSMSVEGNKIRVTFKEVGSGLVLRVPPWMPLEDPTAVAADTAELKGFAIAGDDRKWKFANAVIDGNTVVVSADSLPNPVAVRYDWQECPLGNLANKEGLPAAPFRTDDWDDAHPPAPKPPTAATTPQLQR